MKKQEYTPLKYERSNRLISSRCNMTAAEKDLVNYSLTKLRTEQYSRPEHKFSREELDKGIKITISPNEILTSVFPEKDSSNLGRDLSRICSRLHGLTTVMESDDPDEYWAIYPFIKKCEWKRGVGVTLHFHEDASPLIANLQNKEAGPFTLLDYRVCHQLPNSASKSLYELCTKEYRNKTFMRPNRKYVRKFYDLIDLKCVLGIIDVDDIRVKKLLEKVPEVKSEDNYIPADRIKLMKQLEDIDKTLTKNAKMQQRQVCKWNRWHDFKTRCLDKTKEEMNKIDTFELTFEYEPYTAPGSKKVVGVIFYIFKKENRNVVERILRNEPLWEDVKDAAEAEAEEINDRIYGELQRTVYELKLNKIYEGPSMLTREEVEAVIKASCGTYDVVKEACRKAKAQKHIDSIVGWLISCIKNNYIIDEKPAPRKNSNPSSRNYDYAELERLLLNSSNTNRGEKDTEEVNIPYADPNAFRKNVYAQPVEDAEYKTAPKDNEKTEASKKPDISSMIDEMSKEEMAELLKQLMNKI